ncbi:hypothetical protein [Roseicyclus amphidinii]|uniref:hypothetical protein n=1 Tax=Roseicyclus amphidinii TaxID=3034232 RepID=UPI0024E18F76|nr:hypothetical protein [Roseicyclus sp. Amp-Y-6]
MADELEVRVTVTRKNSTDHAGADHVIATVASMMDDSGRLRFLNYIVATHGVDEEGNPRTPQQMIEAFWSGISAGTTANIQRYEQEVAAQAARDAVAPLAVTQGA